MGESEILLEDRIRRIGGAIYSRLTDTSPSVFDPSWWSGHLLEWAMKDESFKVQMFRFIDVVPVLEESRQVTRFLKEYFESSEEKLPDAFHWGMRAASGAVTSKLVAPMVRKNLELMAHRFIVGKNPEEGIRSLAKLRKKSVAFTVDLLGEATLSEKEADVYQQRYLDVIRFLAPQIAEWESDPLLDEDHRGAVPRLNLSVKLSALSSRLDPVCQESALDEVLHRLFPVLRRAGEYNALVNLDLEQYDLKDFTLTVFQRLLEEKEFQEGPHLGIVVQAYLKDAPTDLEKLLRLARESDRRITVRLVKGAYWDYDTVIRRQKGWTCPLFLRKEETDANYEALSRTLLENIDIINPAFASHNIRSIAHALAVAEELGHPRNACEIQMLNGMAEPIREALVGMGYRVRVYAPIGEMLPGMAYLVRRLLENTSNESFLRKNFVEGVPFEELITAPRPAGETEGAETSPEGFLNEPTADFTAPEIRKSFQASIRKVDGLLGKEYPLVIAGEEASSDKWIDSTNPADPDQVVGRAGSGRPEDVDRCVAAARDAWEEWQKVPPEERAAFLFRAARRIQERRFDFAALQVLEVGKSWTEAYADVCEAIDFLKYYGSEMMRLGTPRRLARYPGELNHYHYVPRGIGVVISPWNFPLAIATGMTSAGIVAGNCVILKPSSNSPVTAAWLVQVFQEAGLPKGVLQFLPGPGEEVGKALVAHAGIDFIAFTGSKEVGLGIVRQAGQTEATQRNVKQVIAEMGGKNAVIVDESADLDEAVRGVLRSAFGFQGQKCSACSRVIVMRQVHPAFVHRLVEAAKSLRIGPPRDPANVMGPVIDQTAQQKILNYIEVGKKEGEPVYLGRAPSQGFFVPPAIFSGITPSHRLFREEIFGPVVSVIEAGEIEEALALANNSEYALTGGIFSRSPVNLDRARSEFRVGNLYINRGITGALVGRQPFGGAAMSGVGSKAGGPDYLLQFMIPRTICENTIRRGFAPEA
jgi:RHH-type proline utilization regulon transcriptional repressor/proline dehydrogenase/delta 1-pyrroline-5-carboxylate dehydrogenase